MVQPSQDGLGRISVSRFSVSDKYVIDETLYDYKDEAQAERRGLWADRNPVEQWLWRRGYR